MIDQLADPTGQALDIVDADAIIRSGFMPWTDLGAENVPEDYMRISTRAIPVIGALAGQSAVGPKLVSVDETGHMQIGGKGRNFGKYIIAGSGATTLVAIAPSQSMQCLYFVLQGNPVNISNIQITGAETGALYYTVYTGLNSTKSILLPLQRGADDHWNIQFQSVPTAPDQFVFIGELPIASVVKVMNDPSAPIYTMGRVQKAPYDSQQFIEPAAGTAAGLTLNSIPNQRWIIDAIVACVQQTGTVAQTPFLSVKDATTEIFRHTFTVPATANTIDRVVLTGLGLVGSFGNSMSVSFNAGFAGVFETLSVCAYKSWMTSFTD